MYHRSHTFKSRFKYRIMFVNLDFHLIKKPLKGKCDWYYPERLLNLIGMTFERKENAQGQLLKDSINWAGCQNNLMSIFTSIKVWKFWKKSADQIWSKNIKIKVSTLMPIRVEEVRRHRIFFIKLKTGHIS